MDWLLKPTRCEYGHHTQKQPTERANSHSTTNVILKSCGLSTISHNIHASPREWNHQQSQNEQMHFLIILLRNQDFHQSQRVLYTVSPVLLVSSSIFFASNLRKSHVHHRSNMFSRCTRQNGGEKPRVVIAQESGVFAFDGAIQGMVISPFPLFQQRNSLCNKQSITQTIALYKVYILPGSTTRKFTSSLFSSAFISSGVPGHPWVP